MLLCFPVTIGSVLLEDSTALLVETDEVSLKLFGGGDLAQRDNITQIKNYNTGLHRTFNTITINDNTSTDDDFVDRFGVGIKSYTFEFITNSTTALTLGSYLLGQFKTPKAELEVVVKTDIAKNIGILDPVSINFTKRHKGFNGSKIPIAGASVAGSEKSPYIIGGMKISPNKTWKVIGIELDTKEFLTTLRLRQV